MLKNGQFYIWESCLLCKIMFTCYNLHKDKFVGKLPSNLKIGRKSTNYAEFL